MKLEKEQRCHNVVTMLAMGAIIVLVCIILTIFYVTISHAESADDLQPNAWILRRMSTDNVLIRKNPTDTDYVYSKIVDNDPPIGAELFLTGESHGKWFQCICLYLPGHPVGWVHQGFIVNSKPRECGRIATVTKGTMATESIGGRESWFCTTGERVKVLYQSDEYSTTIWGMLPSDVLTFMDDGKEVTQPRRASAYWKDWTKRDHILFPVDRW